MTKKPARSSRAVSKGSSAIVALPRGVKAVWDMSKAHRETTPTRERICVNGLWRWQPVTAIADAPPVGDWGYFKVPGPWPGLGHSLYRDSQTVYSHPAWRDVELKNVAMTWYQREIQIPADWAGRRIVLQTEVLNSYAAVYLDNAKAGEITFPGGELDITSACRAGHNYVLSLFVVALPLKTDFGIYAKTLGDTASAPGVLRRGLCGDVYLASAPAGARLDDVTVETSVRNWTVTFRAAVENLAPGRTCRLQARVLDAGKVVRDFTSAPFGAVDLKGGRFEFTSPWKPDALWDIDTPGNTFTFELTLSGSSGNALDTAQPVRFGFREFWIEGRDFYLNGTRIFLFVTPFDNALMGMNSASYEGARETLLRMRKIGINAIYTHHYGCEPGAHVSHVEILRAADDVGMLVSFSLPHALSYDWTAPEADATNNYARDAAANVRYVRNHPSVVMFSLNHNLGYDQDQNPEWMDGLHDELGRLRERRDANSKLNQRTEAIVRRFDNSRVIYHHANGNIGQVYACNFYINFVPVQERSDWFDHWAAKGVKPVYLGEYGPPISMSWTLHRGWDKGKWYDGPMEWTNGKLQYQFCTAEWGSQFLGDRSYDLTEPEKIDMRWEAAQWRAGVTWWRWNYPSKLYCTPPNIDDVIAKYVADNWPAFRTWGLSGFSYWSPLAKTAKTPESAPKPLKVDWSDIQRPGFSPDFIVTPSLDFTTAYRESDWEFTNAGKAFLRNNQPLLAYIAGKPERFTAKDHNFNPGAKFAKQIVVINNSRRTVDCHCSWTLALPKPVTGSANVAVNTGDQARIPLEFSLPANLASGTYRLSMTASFNKGDSQEDFFDVHVMAKPPAVKPTGKIALFDPLGQTRNLLKQMGIRAKSVAADADLANFDVLIVGKAALTLDGPAPDISRVPDGLKVVLFEQTSEVLEKRFGFRVQEYGLRQVFHRIPDHPLLAGLTIDNLRDWSGEATLLPPRLQSLSTPDRFHSVKWCGQWVARPWRAGCRGNVASVLIEKPSRGDFLPVIDGGFNLQYSPLMELRRRNGLVLFCQMDVTGRSESDPAALRLVSNIFDYLGAWSPRPERSLVYAGPDAGLAHLTEAGLNPKPCRPGSLSTDQVLLVAPGGAAKLAPHKDALKAWLKAGGRLLALGLGAEETRALGLTVSMKKAEHIGTCFPAEGQDSPFAGIGPAEVMIRDPRELPLVSGRALALGNGVLARAKDAAVVFCQLVPWEFDYASLYHTKISFRRTSFLVSRLLANMGVAGTTPTLERFAGPVLDPRETRWEDGLYLDKPVAFDDPYRYFRW